MSDIDIGKIFLNFALHATLRAVCAVNVTFICSTGPKLADWETQRPSEHERWARLMRGLTPSPFFAIQQMLWGKEAIFGDWKEEGNPFGWENVLLNLPGSENYDPSLPWVAKIKKKGEIANDVFLYLDDCGPTGEDKEECWWGTCHFASRCNYLGI